MEGKTIQDNKNELPLQHYRALFAAADPADLSRRSGVPFADGVFTTRLLNRTVQVSHPDMAAVFPDTGAALRPNAVILLARLLTGGTLAPAPERFLAYGELPWGQTYLTQFTGRCITRLAYSFANAPEKFAAACERIGGTALKADGTAYAIPFLPELTVRLTIWPAEEDFPPAAQFQFSGNFPLAFSAEDVAYVGDVILDAMKGKL